MFHHNTKCHFKWHFRLPEIKKILAGARFPHKNNIYGFTSFKWIFKGQKIQIYGDKFLFQNIYLAGSKGFWGTLNCLKSPKNPNQNKHLLGNNWGQTWFHYKCHFKWHFQLSKIQKILAGARFPHKNNIYKVGFTSFTSTFQG